MSTHRRFILYFIILGTFWGGSFLGIKYAVAGFGSNFAVFLRCTIALLFVRVFFVHKKPVLPKKYLWQVCATGFFGMAFPWIFLFWAEKTVVPALAALINSSTTLFVVLLTPFFNPKDVIAKNQWVGVFLGILGIAVIFWPELRLSSPNQQLLSMLALLMTALMYGIANQWTRRFSHVVDNRINAYYQMLFCSFFMLVFSFVFDQQVILPGFTYKAVLAVLYLGVFSTGLAILLNYWIIKNVGGVQSAAIVFLIPIVSIALDLIVLKQSLSLNQYLGGAVIMGALYFLNTPTRWFGAQVDLV